MNEIKRGKKKKEGNFSRSVVGTSSGPVAGPVQLPAIGRAPLPSRREPGERQTAEEKKEEKNLISQELKEIEW